MNVLFVINTLHRGGAEAHLLLLSRGLRQRGVHCEVAFLRSDVGGGSVDLREDFEHDGTRTHYLACERSYDLRGAFRVRRLLAERSWHVLHSHLPRADGAAALALAGRRPPPMWVCTLHHPYDNAYSGAPLIPLLAPMWRRADGVIAVSESVRQWAIGRLGLAPARVRTVMHGIDIRGGRTVASGRGHRIGSIGRYEPRKNHETLIRAMPHILRTFPDATLNIAGHDPWGYGEQLRRLIAGLGLTDHVTLSGFMTDKDAFFAAIDLFAFASRSEGFGIVLLEAMAAGKPSVVTDIPPLNTIVEAGISGLTATPDDPESFARAIVALFGDPARLQQMGAAAHRRVAAAFSPDAMVDNTLACYRDVLASGRA